MSAPRRILAAVDSSPLSLMAAEAAAMIAQRTGAELLTIFIEDINIVRLSSHASVHTFSPSATRSRELHGSVLEKALELQSIAARRAHDQLVAARALKGGFMVRRGRVEAELMSASADVDLVCVGWSGRAVPGFRPRLGSVARNVIAQAGRTVMAVRRPHSGPVMAVWDGSAAACRAVAAAAMVADEIALIVAADDDLEAARLAEQAHQCTDHPVVLRPLRVASVTRLPADLLADGLLVLAEGGAWSPDASQCSLMVVR